MGEKPSDRLDLPEPDEASRWYTAAQGDAGDTAAQYNLGVFLATWLAPELDEAGRCYTDALGAAATAASDGLHRGWRERDDGGLVALGDAHRQVWCHEWLPTSVTLQATSSPQRSALSPSSIAAAHQAPPRCSAAASQSVS